MPTQIHCAGDHASRSLSFLTLVVSVAFTLATAVSCTADRVSRSPQQTTAATAPAVKNGGFEAYDYHWWHPEDAYAGELDAFTQVEGRYSWRFDLDAYPRSTYITHGASITPGATYDLQIWIRCEGIAPADAVSVKVQRFSRAGPGRFITIDGSPDLIRTGGTHDWSEFRVTLPPDVLADSVDAVVVYLSSAAEARGSVWFDALDLWRTGVRPRSLDNVLSSSQRATSTVLPALARLSRREPGERWPSTPRIEIDTGSDSNVFVGSSPTSVTIGPASDADSVRWEITDYDGRVVANGAGSDLAEVAESGYFDVWATAYRGGAVVSSRRASIGRLASMPIISEGAYPFGSWVQQDDLLPVLGAHWTRMGLGWRYLEPHRGVEYEPLWAQIDDQLDEYADLGIKTIFFFDKVPEWAGRHSKIAGTEVYGAFRQYVRRCITRYGNRVDVWEAMNEPEIPDLYPGTLDDIVAVHRIVREEVDRFDPGALVIGPCINFRQPHLFNQMRDLFALGLGALIDGLSVHTYGGLEADGFVADLDSLRALTQGFGYDLPLYITEHGLSVPDKPLLERLQASHLVRTILLSMQADVKALIWHMMSWPEGEPAREREFAIVHAAVSKQLRQPRPAFVAAAVASDLLGRARYVADVEGLPNTVEGVQFDVEGTPLYALWSWGQPQRDIEVHVESGTVDVIDIVGRRQTLRTSGGRLTLTVSADPVFVQGAGSLTVREAP